MKVKNIIIAALLVLIGILAGSLLTIYLSDTSNTDRANVRFTEIVRSDRAVDSSDSNTETPKPEFNAVAQDVTKTVVFIESLIQLSESDIPEDEEHNFSDKFWDDILPQRRVQTAGSGVLISSDGYILTNNHVVEGGKNNIKVTLKNKKAYDARIVGTDPNTDLAVLKIDANQLPHALIGDSDNVKVGDWVLAVGNPFRLRSTVTAGIVSALSRQVQIINESLSIESFIQTDAAINRGNSGGALVNKNGELIGINTAIATETGNYQGYGFAVPVNLAVKVAKDIIEYGKVQRALLGITISQIDYERAMYLGMSKVKGVEVAGLVEGGAAREYGLKPGDVILKVNGVETNEVSVLQERVALQRPGDLATLEIWRDGKVDTVEIILKGIDEEQFTASNENSPPEEKMKLEEPELDSSSLNTIELEIGIDVVELPSSSDVRKRDYIVLSVRENSTAWNQGFRKGFEILELNGRAVDNLNSLRDIVQSLLKDDKAAEFLVEDKIGRTFTIKIEK